MSNVKKENKGLKPIEKSPKVDWIQYLFRPGIYHWRYFSTDIGGYTEYSLDETDSLGEMSPDDRCIEVELFNFPVNETKDCGDLIREYFHEAFEDWAFNDGAKLKDFFTILIIPKNIYHEILNEINDFELLHIKDLLLEVIAISQYIITHELWLWNTPEYRRMRLTARAETEKAIKVIELSGVHHKSLKAMEEKPSPGLSSIIFKFNDKTSIKIQHNGLIKEFVVQFMQYYDELKNKDWRKDLATYPERFGESHLKESFQKQIILAYYKLFTDNNWLVSDTKHPSRMMRCIVCMLEFSLSHIGGDKDKTEFEKGKNVSELLRQMGY